MRTDHRFLALILFALVLPVMAFAQDDPAWTVGFGGGVATRYTYKTTRSTIIEAAAADHTLGNTWMASLSVNRKLGGRVSLQTGLDYFKQEQSEFAETAKIACLSAGLRVSSRRMAQASPYVEALPALFGAKWNDDLHDYSISSIRPGAVVGTGIVLGTASSRLKLDVGVRGFFSTGWPSLPDPNNSAKYHGVKRMSFGGTLLYGF